MTAVLEYMPKLATIILSNIDTNYTSGDVYKASYEESVVTGLHSAGRSTVDNNKVLTAAIIIECSLQRK